MSATGRYVDTGASARKPARAAGRRAGAVNRQAPAEQGTALQRLLDGWRERRRKRAAAQAASRGVHYATSPLLASKTPLWRSRFVVALLALGFFGLVARAAYIQVVATDFYLEKGAERYGYTLTLPATRGRILDRNGTVLATSIPAPSVWIVPKDFKATPQQRARLAQILGIPVADLNNRANDEGEFAWLKRQVDEGVWEQVQALAIPGVHQVREFKRKYPEGEAAAHVVGFTTVEELGLQGIEANFDRKLKGTSGQRNVVRDRQGAIVEDGAQWVEPVNGQDVQLALDAKIQFYAWQQLQAAVKMHNAQAASAVVLDAVTGEILALANYPGFDPAKRYPNTSPLLRNRVITDVFEPGSTMKPFIAGWALETRRVTPRTVLQTASFEVPGKTIRDSHPHPQLTVQEVVQKSSNVGTAQLAMRMERREMWELYSQLGFGERPKVDFQGPVTGRLRPWKAWRPVDQATMSYGYGVSTSLLQLARAYTALARDGDVVPLTILKRDENKANAPLVGTRVFSPATVAEVRTMLHLAASKGGTAPRAQNETIGYSVGGKTGTAHKQIGSEYATNRYRSWFVGLAPISAPRIVVAVMVDDPSKGIYFGGDVAAPVFAQIVQQSLRALNVPPDIPVKPQIALAPEDTAQESFQ